MNRSMVGRRSKQFREQALLWWLEGMVVKMLLVLLFASARLMR